MSPLPHAAQQTLQAFSSAASWEARARLLLQWGQTLEPVTDSERTSDNLVSGCESQVWLLAELRDGHWHFRADSDARLIRGLLAVLLARVQGLPSDALQQLALADWFAQLGLSRQLSPSRSNGLNAVLQRMSSLAGTPAANSSSTQF